MTLLPTILAALLAGGVQAGTVLQTAAVLTSGQVTLSLTMSGAATEYSDPGAVWYEIYRETDAGVQVLAASGIFDPTVRLVWTASWAAAPFISAGAVFLVVKMRDRYNGRELRAPVQ